MALLGAVHDLLVAEGGGDGLLLPGHHLVLAAGHDLLVGGGGVDGLLLPGHLLALVLVGGGDDGSLGHLLGHCLLPGHQLAHHGGGDGGAHGFLLRHNVLARIQLDISLEWVTFNY